MSGRLIILPKKSYTPWNPQNTERVQRDERLHKERLEKEEEERRIQDNKQRIQLMKERMKRFNNQVDNDDDDGHVCDECDTVQKEDKGISLESSHYSHTENNGKSDEYKHSINSNSYSHNDHLKHVNLFEEEEKQMLQNFVENTCKNKGGNNEKMKQSVGIMPVFLTERPGRKNVVPTCTTESKAVGSLCDSNKPFYERDDCLRKEIDDKVKIRYDPMNHFVKNIGDFEDSGGKDCSGSVLKTIELKSKQELQKSDYRNVHKGDRDRKKKKRKKDDSSSRSKGKNDEKYKSRRRKKHEFISNSSNTRPTSKMDELKARKLEREQSELDREEALKRA